MASRLMQSTKVGERFFCKREAIVSSFYFDGTTVSYMPFYTNKVPRMVKLDISLVNLFNLEFFIECTALWVVKFYLSSSFIVSLIRIWHQRSVIRLNRFKAYKILNLIVFNKA